MWEDEIDNYVVALAGNPNVGKSTVFNGVTGLKQHTGNWTGKTVESAAGHCRYSNTGKEVLVWEGGKEKPLLLVDLPGTYSLLTHSKDEEVTRDYLCSGRVKQVVVVCDATCLERNLNLVLQCMEIHKNVLVCVNLMNEAKRKGINVNLSKLSDMLGVPVVGVGERNKDTFNYFLKMLVYVINERERIDKPFKIAIKRTPTLYDTLDGDNASIYNYSVISAVRRMANSCKVSDWVAMRLMLGENIAGKCPADLENEITHALNGQSKQEFADAVVGGLVSHAEKIAKETVSFNGIENRGRDWKVDRILTHRIWGVPLMICLIGIIFWITLKGANVPSAYLSKTLFGLGEVLRLGLVKIGAGEIFIGMLIDGIYRVLAWVVAVMLPPMAIFFPMFTILEDVGYLPRVAFNLDKYFQKAKACGKQALTICMGFGCNAAGVVGCRIIDSPRERLIAILTNAFVPCNGRFPTLILLIGIIVGGVGFVSGLSSALLLTTVIVAGVAMTFLISRLLSGTILKGIPSSFTLELPPYRRPQIGKILIRSLLDRTLFVLGRAVAVAAPAGLVIWLMANLRINDITLLNHAALFLDPIGNIMGLDGIILLAFILGFPANEIVFPIVMMGYMASGQITEITDIAQISNILFNNGWSIFTALSMIVFSLFHFPCSTTCLSIKKETGSWKWTAVAFILPTIIGFICCCLINLISKFF